MKIPGPLSRLFIEPVALNDLVPSALQPYSGPARQRIWPRPVPQRLVEVEGFGRNPGNLRMYEYVPLRPVGEMPLVVVLHGCLQNAEDFDRASGWTALARDHGFAVLYVEQKSSNNTNLCFNWFRPSQVARDRGELGSIREMIEFSRRRHAIDAGRIFVMGLSAGASMASALLATYPELFAAGSIVAGLPLGSARDAMTALSVMKNAARRTPEEWATFVRQASPEARRFPAVSIWHGTSDSIVSFANAEASLSQWLAVHGLGPVENRARPFEGGIRREWHGDDGVPVVEMVALDGFDHGLPVGRMPAGASPANETERFMLPAPISAPECLVRSWRLDRR